MEILLLIIIIVFVILTNNKTASLNNKIEILIKKINDLKIQIAQKPERDVIPEKEISNEVPTGNSTETIDSQVVQFDATNKIVKGDPKVVKIEEVITPPKPQKVTIKKPSVRQPTFNDKISERIAKFKKDNPDIETFVGENLVSKIGIFILVLGISFFVKYAIDQDWINEAGRVGIGFLSGAILLGFAHRLQKNYKAFSSILVSGAFVVFYFVITYSFKEYKLFNQTVAFGLMVVVTIFSVVISILYNRKELGILSLIGGFSVPILASTGSGNYVMLFTYLLILNIGFLIVAINRKWFVINILAFVFTHFFFFGWLFSDTEITLNAPTLFVFATLFYLVFFAMNILRIIKEKEYTMKPIVMSLFLISTFVYFGQGLYLLGFFAPSFKGFYTLLLALINLGTGWQLLNRKVIDKKTVYLFIGMTLTFLTLTGPIQLEGNYITLFWAAEVVLLAWLSQKIKNNRFKLAAAITLFLALASLSMDFEQIYKGSENLRIIFNKGFLTGIFTVLSLSFTAFLVFKEKTSYYINSFKFDSSKTAILLVAIAGVVLYITGLLELTHQTEKYFDYYLASTIKTIYNYIFVVGLIVYLFKNRKTAIIGVIVSILAILFSIIFLSNLPFDAFRASVIENTTNPSFYIQLILLLLVFYIMRLLYIYVSKEGSVGSKNNYISYFIATVFVILISLELLIISQPIVVIPKLALDVDASVYGVIGQSKRTVIKTIFPIIWGILSFIFLYFGIRNSKKEWRLFSLFLIAVTVVKLFTYDIGNVSQGGKIVAFIILGVVLLVISFMYQKIKRAFFKDEKDKE
ncbi:MAG: DUF2339 domain-containing protein [Flavobacteriaceae bacterium]|nr:DUF2339 domain-containing protein [Flavobacteriaceae bacterium]